MATKSKKKRQIHVVYGKRGGIPIATHPLDCHGETLVPLRGELLVRHIPVKKKRMVCQKCGLPFWSVDHERLYCLFCASSSGNRAEERRQKTRRENIDRKKHLKLGTTQ